MSMLRSAYAKVLGPQARQRAVAFTRRNRDGLLITTGFGALCWYFYSLKKAEKGQGGLRTEAGGGAIEGVKNYGGSGITARPIEITEIKDADASHKRAA